MTTISAVVFLYSPDTKIARSRSSTSTKPATPAGRGLRGADRGRVDGRDLALHGLRPLDRARTQAWRSRPDNDAGPTCLGDFAWTVMPFC
jgi:hypothetical protein